MIMYFIEDYMMIGSLYPYEFPILAPNVLIVGSLNI